MPIAVVVGIIGIIMIAMVALLINGSRIPTYVGADSVSITRMELGLQLDQADRLAG
jgi:hypothetical protein